MTVRLTESRLRQIIREELLESLGYDLNVANKIANEYSHYIDLEINDTTGKLSLTPLHYELTDEVGELIDPGLDRLDILAILIGKDPFEVRIYVSEMDLEEASELLPGETITPNPAFRAPRAMQMRNPYGEPVNAPMKSPRRTF